MEQNAICAVVVTYHPDEDLTDNLAALRPQVTDLIVVDNGSSQWEIALLGEAAERLGFTLVQNWENLGMAAALNRGVTYAREKKFDWVILFDQDSTVPRTFVATMLQCATHARDAKSLAILMPMYRDVLTGTMLEPPARDHFGLEAAKTSGSLMPTEIFDVAGLFDETLFIDGVDYEYSLRVRQLGLRIDECRDAILLHSAPTPTSPVRLYYQERNRVLIFKRYGRIFRSFCMRQFISSAKDFIKILGVEDDKWNKCRYFLRGVRDGFRGRSGKLAD